MLKSKIFKTVFVVLLVFVLFFNMFFLAKDSFWSGIKNLPTGKFLYSSMSPDGNSTLKIFIVTVKNVGTGIRGEVVTKDENGKNLTKNIYWETNTKSAIASWINENTVNINGNDVSIASYYDSRKQIALPEAAAKNVYNKTK